MSQLKHFHLKYFHEFRLIFFEHKKTTTQTLLNHRSLIDVVPFVFILIAHVVNQLQMWGSNSRRN